MMAQMQSQLANAQKKMDTIEVKGSSGAGAIEVVMNGKMKAKSIAINKSLLGIEISDEDVSLLEDLLLAAFNDAQGTVEKTLQGALGGMLPK